jgi:putative ABC transport system permease protein
MCKLFIFYKGLRELKMTLKNIKLKINMTTIFFVIAYTLIIFSFSIGISIIENQQIKINNRNPKNNKVIVIKSDSIKLEDIILSISDEDITLNAEVLVNINKSESFKLVTNYINKRLILEDEVKVGENFKKEDYVNTNNFAIFSPMIRLQDNSYKFSYFDMSNNIKEEKLIAKGITYSTESKIWVNNNIFNDYINARDLLASEISIKINADEYELEDLQQKIYLNLKNIDQNVGVEFLEDFESKDFEISILFKIIVSIFIIIILNSVNITGLWVENRKKEIGIRKAVGATNTDLVKLLFYELTSIAIFSMILVFLIQIILIKINFFDIFNIQINMYSKNLIYSLLLSISIASLSSLPAYYYLFRFQIIDVISEA